MSETVRCSCRRWKGVCYAVDHGCLCHAGRPCLSTKHNCVCLGKINCLATVHKCTCHKRYLWKTLPCKALEHKCLCVNNMVTWPRDDYHLCMSRIHECICDRPHTHLIGMKCRREGEHECTCHLNLAVDHPCHKTGKIEHCLKRCGVL